MTDLFEASVPVGRGSGSVDFEQLRTAAAALSPEKKSTSPEDAEEEEGEDHVCCVERGLVAAEEEASETVAPVERSDRETGEREAERRYTCDGAKVAEKSGSEAGDKEEEGEGDSAALAASLQQPGATWRPQECAKLLGTIKGSACHLLDVVNDVWVITLSLSFSSNLESMKMISSDPL